MAFEVETPTATHAKVRIRVPSEEIEGAIRHEFAHLRERANLKGFRPGKVPRKVLERRYGGALEADVARRLLEESFREALAKHHLHPVEAPALKEDDLKRKPDGSVQVDLELDVVPHFEPENFRGLRVPVPPIQLDPADVEREIEGLRQQNGTAEPVQDGLTAAGDLILADLVFQFLDGTSLPRMENRPIDTRAGALDGIRCEAAIGRFVGCSRGQSVKLTVELPQEFAIAEHRGKTAVVDCTVKDARRIILPDVEAPAFLEALGVKSGEELRAKVRERMLQLLKARQDRIVEELCVEQLLDRNPFPIPDRLVQRNVDAERERLRKEMTERGASSAEIEQRLLEVDGRLRQQIERKVRETFLLDRIAEKEETQVAPEEVEAHFLVMARALEIPPDRLFEHFQSEGLLPRVIDDLRRDKVRRQLRSAAITSENDEKRTESPSETEETS